MEGTVTVLNWLGFLGNVIAQCHVYLMILCNSFSNLILFTICEHYIILAHALYALNVTNHSEHSLSLAYSFSLPLYLGIITQIT